MTHEIAPIDRETADSTTKSIALAGDLLKSILDDPDILDEIPDEATVLLLPFDDPVMGLQNLALGFRLVAKGKTVYFRRMGSPGDIKQTMPFCRPSSLHPEHLVVSFSFDDDKAVFDFSGMNRPPARLAIAPRIALRVDRETREVVGYEVPEAMIEHLHEAPEAARQDVPEGYRFGIPAPEAVASFTEDLARRAA